MTFDRTSQPIYRQAGMTLIEVLVVLVVIGLAWFTLLPNLNLADRPRGQSGAMQEANEMLSDVRDAAQKSDAQQFVYVGIGLNYLTWGDRRASLPDSVSQCQVNGMSLPQSKGPFRVYPSGIMDEVRLVMADGSVAESNVLGVEFSINR